MLTTVALALFVVLAGEDSPPDAREVRPLLARYCLACHGDKQPKGELNLAPDRLGADVWHAVWERLRTRQMPPSDRPQPTSAERERLTSWIEASFGERRLGGRPDPGPLSPRRLNVREHANTLRDLAFGKDGARPRKVSYRPKPDGTISLYHAIVPPPEHPCAFVARQLPPDTTDGGFDTISENLSLPPFLVEKYLRCSRTLLTAVLSSKSHPADQAPLQASLAKLRTGPPPKGQTQRQAVATFVQEFASRAFRRPVSSDEVARYVKLFEDAQDAGQEFDSAILLPLEAMLVSPRFTVLWAESAEAAESVRPLDDYELAARLSYFLWSSLPDRELFQLARQGRLQDAEVLEQQTRRMLQDQRVTDGLVTGFLGQWLQLDKLDRAAPDAELFPEYFQQNLAELMRQELLLFADAVLVEDRSLLEFLDADWGLLCYPLAQHYGLLESFPGKKPPSNAAPNWYRVTFPDKRRGGLLAMGKVLVGTSQPQRTSPVHRGKWVLETILGTPPPPPPPDVDNVLKEPADGTVKLTVPQRLARHRDQPACHSCHQMIDPLGVAFERFDPVGRWRDRDLDQPIDTRGTLTDGRSFDGVVELKSVLLARREEFVRGFVERMLTYALGRKLDLYDVPTVKQIAASVAADEHRFSRVVVEVVKSYSFRHRRTGG